MGLGDILGMMRDFGSLKQKIEATQDRLARETVEGSAGGGMVRATANGRGELVDLVIEREVIDPDDAGLLVDLVKAAVGQALDKARDLQREGMMEMLGGMPMPPGLEGLLGQ